MKIVHIVPNASYTDYWGYQDNLLPKYQRKLGHDVTVIATTRLHKNGRIVVCEPTSYVLDDGLKIIRLPYKKYKFRTVTGVFSKFDVLEILKDIKPDFVFYHGLLSATIFDVIKYKKRYNQNCVIVEDNHLDYNIGMARKTLKQKMICQWFRMLNRTSVKYVDKVYGVTPWRKTYAEDYFKIPSDKTDVLIMGADDEKIDFNNRDAVRTEIRRKYNISDSDFLIATGGKIDSKKNIHILMRACSEMPNVKLLVFGQVLGDVRDEFNSLLDNNENIIYIGWIASDKVYDYFFAADLVFFPGQHSVLWEQACASKVPCVFEKWDGMEHVNNGGNSDFIFPVTKDTVKNKISELCFTPKYYEMKKIAESDATDIYLYSKIAEKSLECAYVKKQRCREK